VVSGISKPKRFLHLDGIRGISIVLVLLNHIFGTFGSGFLGVDIFFVVSGYIITYNILRGKYSSPIGFYRQRALKILPPLLVTIVAVSFIYLWQGGAWYKAVNYVYLFLVNLHFMKSEVIYDGINIVRNSPISHLWSLSVEEQFYIFAPFMLLLYKKKIKLLYIALTILTLSSLLLYTINYTEFPSINNYYTSIGRFWELGIGCLLAIILYKKGEYSLPRLLTLPFIFIIMLIALQTYKSNLSLHKATIAVTLLTIALILSSESKILKSKVAVFLGERSYSIYLYHIPIAFLILQYHDNFIGMSATLLLTILLSALSYKYLEHPILGSKVSTRRLMISVLLITIILASSTNLIARHGPVVTSKTKIVEKIQLEKELTLFCESALVSCNVKSLKSKLDANASYWLCAEHKDFDNFEISQCLIREGLASEKKIMVAGDSVASSFIPGLYKHAINDQYNLYTNVAYGCSWFLVDENDIYNAKETNIKCNENARRLHAYQAKISPDVLILSLSAMNRYNSLEGENIEGHRQVVVNYMIDAVEKYLKTSKKIVLVVPPPYLEAKNCERPVDPVNKCDHAYDKISDRVAINKIWKAQLIKVAKSFNGSVVVRDSATGTCYPSAEDCRWETKYGNARASQVHLTYWASLLFGKTLNNWTN